MKFFPLVDTRPSCHEFTTFFDEHQELITEHIASADYLVVGGGDGRMLDCMRRYGDQGIPFLGLNCGTRGFLLNIFDAQELLTLSHDTIDLVDARCVETEIYHTDGRVEYSYFLNDVTLGGSVLDYFSFSVTTVDTESNKEKCWSTKGTGLIVCTALGSTGYALNVSQPLLPLESRMWGISGLATAPFNYTFVQPQEITIVMSGRSIGLIGLDGYNETHEDVEKIICRPSKKKAQLAFFRSQPFVEKRLLLAEEKLGR